MGSKKSKYQSKHFCCHHFKYLGVIEAFVILQKKEGILGKSSEGLSMCWFYHCIYHDIRCAVLAVLIGYWSCANTCITLGHHRIDNQASLTLGLNGVCFYILFVVKAALASIFGCNASEWWVVSKWLRWERSKWIELNFLSFIRFSRWLIERTGHRTARY